MARYAKKRPTLAELVIIGRTGKRQKQLINSNDVSTMLPVVCSGLSDDNNNASKFWESGNAIVGVTVIHHTNTKELLSRSQKVFNRMHFLSPEAEKIIEHDRKVITDFYNNQRSQFDEALQKFRQQPPLSPSNAVCSEEINTASDEPYYESVRDPVDTQISLLDVISSQRSVVSDKSIPSSPPYVAQNPIGQSYSPFSPGNSGVVENPIIVHQEKPLFNSDEPFDFENEDLLQECEHSEARASTINLLNRLADPSNLHIEEPLSEQIVVESSGISPFACNHAVDSVNTAGAASVAAYSIDGNSTGENSIGDSIVSESNRYVDTSPARILLQPVALPQIATTGPNSEDSPLRALTRRLLRRTNTTKAKDLDIVQWSPAPEEPPEIRLQRSVVDTNPFESHFVHNEQDWLIRNYLEKRPRRRRKQKVRQIRQMAFNHDYLPSTENQYHLWGPVANTNSEELDNAYMITHEPLLNPAEISAMEVDIEASNNTPEGSEIGDTNNSNLFAETTSPLSSSTADRTENPIRVNDSPMALVPNNDRAQNEHPEVTSSEDIRNSLDNLAWNEVNTKANSLEIKNNYTVGSPDLYADNERPPSYNDHVGGEEIHQLISDTDGYDVDRASDSWNETGMFQNAPNFEFNSFDRLPRLLAAGSMVNQPHPYDHDPLSDIRELAPEEIDNWHRANEEKLSEDFFNDLVEFIHRALETSIRISFEHFYHAVKRAHQGKVRPHLYLYALTFIAQQKIIELTQSVHTQHGLHSQIIIEKLIP